MFSCDIVIDETCTDYMDKAIERSPGICMISRSVAERRGFIVYSLESESNAGYFRLGQLYGAYLYVGRDK